MKIHKTAQWFSRHQPTNEQLEEIDQIGFELVGVEDGIELGSIPINDEQILHRIAERLVGKVVFGVFPAPLRMLWWCDKSTRPRAAWEAWNISRTPNGASKPTFTHKLWGRTL